jgi:hypothetical protein
MAHGGRTIADDALAAALAEGKTVRDAVVAAGVSERTAYRRLGDPAFRQKVSEIRARMLERAAGVMADGMRVGNPEIRRKSAEVAATLLDGRTCVVVTSYRLVRMGNGSGRGRR